MKLKEAYLNSKMKLIFLIFGMAVLVNGGPIHLKLREYDPQLKHVNYLSEDLEEIIHDCLQDTKTLNKSGSICFYNIKMDDHVQGRNNRRYTNDILRKIFTKDLGNSGSLKNEIATIVSKLPKTKRLEMLEKSQEDDNLPKTKKLEKLEEDDSSANQSGEDDTLPKTKKLETLEKSQEDDNLLKTKKLEKLEEDDFSANQSGEDDTLPKTKKLETLEKSQEDANLPKTENLENLNEDDSSTNQEQLTKEKIKELFKRVNDNMLRLYKKYKTFKNEALNTIQNNLRIHLQIKGFIVATKNLIELPGDLVYIIYKGAVKHIFGNENYIEDTMRELKARLMELKKGGIRQSCLRKPQDCNLNSEYAVQVDKDADLIKLMNLLKKPIYYESEDVDKLIRKFKPRPSIDPFKKLVHLEI